MTQERDIITRRIGGYFIDDYDRSKIEINVTRFGKEKYSDKKKSMVNLIAILTRRGET